MGGRIKVGTGPWKDTRGPKTKPVVRKRPTTTSSKMPTTTTTMRRAIVPKRAPIKKQRPKTTTIPTTTTTTKRQFKGPVGSVKDIKSAAQSRAEKLKQIMNSP